MAANKNLGRARQNKNDEFYTQLTDIEKELRHYKEHFKGKRIFCNCDDPEFSNFWRYFELNFDHLGLQSLTSTHYNETTATYRLDMFRDEAGNVVSSRTPLEQNGDFRSPEAIAILDASDIVVTNPPFSLFREYVALLIEKEKHFIIIGSMNAVTYKETFNLIKENKMWLGNTSGGMTFEVPNKEEYANKSGFFKKDGRAYSKLGNISWYTNLDIAKRHEDLLTWREYNKDDYPSYDNYDIINVNKIVDIPADYDGLMGVPITYFSMYNPSQFEVVGLANSARWLGEVECYTIIDGKKIYNRVIIKRRSDLGDN